MLGRLDDHESPLPDVEAEVAEGIRRERLAPDRRDHDADLLGLEPHGLTELGLPAREPGLDQSGKDMADGDAQVERVA